MIYNSENLLQITRDHFCPIFFGCVLSATNISPERRTALAEMVMSNGGRYEGTLYNYIYNLYLCTNIITRINLVNLNRRW